jgi:2-dehydro-3-deoxyphosphogluconate aldolase/(4S)-4-hydroxy-2-oxoglutarate aldolase
VTKQEVRARIAEIGIVPVIRASSAEEAKFAAESISSGGIPIVEITMTVPGAVEVIAELRHTSPNILVGAGTVLNRETALRCAHAGAQFLVSPGSNDRIFAAARETDLLLMAGALTPTEVMAAWESGADFVKIFPCGSMGGPNYIKALKGPLPQVAMVPTGGVNLETATDYIKAGVAALGVGGELVQKQALQCRNGELLRRLAEEFVELVKRARGGGRKENNTSGVGANHER